jgi:hypothetical protein
MQVGVVSMTPMSCLQGFSGQVAIVLVVRDTTGGDLVQHSPVVILFFFNVGEFAFPCGRIVTRKRLCD